MHTRQTSTSVFNLYNVKQCGLVCALLALTLWLTGCDLGPDAGMLNDIRNDYERFKGFEQKFVNRFDQLEESNDSLKHAWSEQISVEIAKDPIAVSIWSSLQTEYINLHRLYEAFLLEYRLELERMDKWMGALPETEKSDDQIKQEWEAFNDGFKQNLETEEQIQTDIQKWKSTFENQIEKLSVEFERQR